LHFGFRNNPIIKEFEKFYELENLIQKGIQMRKDNYKEAASDEAGKNF
jgi:hypothetical protein